MQPGVTTSLPFDRVLLFFNISKVFVKILLYEACYEPGIHHESTVTKAVDGLPTLYQLELDDAEIYLAKYLLI